MEYCYNDGDLYYFMDHETYDMIPLSKDILPDAFKFIKENDGLHHPVATRAMSLASSARTLSSWSSRPLTRPFPATPPRTP